MHARGYQAADAHRRTEAQSRTPLELVVMLYDGALRFAGQARTAIERRDIAARRDAISRALAIMSELRSTLDMQKGGAISESLDALYVYIVGRFVEAAVTQDAGPLDEAVRVLSTMRDAWAELSSQEPGAQEAL